MIGAFVTKAGGDNGDNHLVLQLLIEVGTPNDLTIRVNRIGHDGRSCINLFQTDIRRSGNVQQYAPGTLDRGVQQRRSDSLLCSHLGLVLALGAANTHVGITGVLHDLGHIGKVRVYQTGSIYQVRNGLHALAQYIIRNLKSVEQGDLLIGHILQVFIGNDHQGVHILSQILDTLFCLIHTTLALKSKGSGHNANGKNTHILGNLRYNGSSAGTGTTAHTGSDKYHLCAGHSVSNRLAALLGGTSANLRLSAGAATLGGLFADLNLMRSGRLSQSRTIRVDRNKLHILNITFYHAVHGVTAAAANTDYFNLNNLVVIRINFITSHRLCISFIYFVNPSVCQQTTLQIIL